MQRLDQLIGRELAPEALAQDLCSWVGRKGHRVVGAVLVTCADESEREGGEAFQRGVVERLLPRLKTGVIAPFRICNLGSRYEPGALTVAESHFALAGEGTKLMLVKVSSHVAAGEHEGVLGRLRRYQGSCRACGALHALLDGRDDLPFLQDLRQSFATGDTDRLGVLAGGGAVDDSLRPLVAAVCNAQLQAGRALDEARRLTPRSPTDWLVLSTVVVNRRGRDGELLCGYAWMPDGAQEPEAVALGDDPAGIRLTSTESRLVLERAQS